MHCYKKCITVALLLVFEILLTMAFIYNLHYLIFFLFSAKGLFKLCIIKKMLNGCSCFRSKLFLTMSFRYTLHNNCFLVFLGKRIVKSMHCYKTFLIVALVLVFKIFLIMALAYFLQNNVFLLISARRLFKLALL